MPSGTDATNAALLDLARRSNPQMASQLSSMSNEQLKQYGQQLMQSNPQFAAFVQLCQGIPLGQVARKHGINI